LFSFNKNLAPAFRIQKHQIGWSEIYGNQELAQDNKVAWRLGVAG